ncbi:LSU ribosomal protein L10p (P0) [Candidatus Phaeomarinobacter ectocarpi]|uniref:Large ribosomal subunit protein uL10 n=1 Tax=Candidatus Phaeomarinibacter ectocarpi TaxID=1458461 RepID=X5MK70_9HYPH|nr:50S ribosomal protein L10 [Candidatus Phaeomarinobacter ectocarpi]CDO58300.1 LSU ribosomal protein L10p (P0) [Candidatus Phaeomarinobacter ectocarpi]
MERAEKDALVSTLNGVFSDAGVVVVTHYSGLNVAELSELRRDMAEAGASFRVTKNRLAKRALESTSASEITDLFTGPTAIGVSDDPVAAPRILAKFAKANEKLIIRGGIMGDTVLDETGIKALADLPSLDELRGKIVGMLNTPATRIAGVLAAPGGQVARVIAAKAEQGDAA